MNTLENRYRPGRPTLLVGGLAGLFVVVAGMPLPATAANPAYGSFLPTVCGATGASANLNAVACAPGGASPDSQSSLNPSQPLAGNDQPLARAREKAASLQKDKQENSGKTATAEPAAQIGPFSLLVNGRGSWFNRDASGGERGYDGDAYSIEVGLDRRLSARAVVGAFLSYERTDLNFDREGATTFTPPANPGGTQVDSAALVLFGAYNLSDAIYLEAATGYGVSDYEFRRNAVAQAGGPDPPPLTVVRTRGDSNGHDYWLSAGAGYDINHGAASYGVFARTTWARAQIDGYREKDLNASGFALSVGDAKRSSLTTTLGVRASRAVSFGWGVLVPQARLEYEHEFENDPPGVATAFADVVTPGLSFSPARDKPDQDWFNLAVGAQFILPGGLMPFVEAEALAGQRNFDRYRVLLGVRSEF